MHTSVLVQKGRRLVVSFGFAINCLACGCATYSPLQFDPEVILMDSSKVMQDWVSNFEINGRSADTPITLWDLQEIALRSNPEILTERSRVRVVAFNEKVSGRLDDPEFEFSVLRSMRNVDKPWTFAAGASFAVPLFGQRTARMQLATAELLEAITSLAVAESNLMADVAAAHLDYSRAAILLDFAAYLQGTHPGWSFDAQVLGDLESEVKSSTSALRALLGILPDQPLAVETSLSGQKPEFNLNPRTLMESSLLVKQSLRGLEMADAAYKLAIRMQYPQLNLGPLFEWEEDESSLGFGFSIPVPLFGNAKNSAESARMERDTALKALAAQLYNVTFELSALSDEIDQLQLADKLPDFAEFNERYSDPGEMFQHFQEFIDQQYKALLTSINCTRLLGQEGRTLAHTIDLIKESR